jgi:hypothetical protein
VLRIHLNRYYLLPQPTSSLRKIAPALRAVGKFLTAVSFVCKLAGAPVPDLGQAGNMLDAFQFDIIADVFDSLGGDLAVQSGDARENEEVELHGAAYAALKLLLEDSEWKTNPSLSRVVYTQTGASVWMCAAHCKVAANKSEEWTVAEQSKESQPVSKPASQSVSQTVPQPTRPPSSMFVKQSNKVIQHVCFVCVLFLISIFN